MHTFSAEQDKHSSNNIQTHNLRTAQKKKSSYRIPSPVLETGKHLGEKFLDDVSELVGQALLGKPTGGQGAHAGALGGANAVQQEVELVNVLLALPQQLALVGLLHIT